MMQITAMLDPDSNAAIARMMNPELLDPAIINMLDQTTEDLQKAATDYMYATFMNPSGGVENAWETEKDSTFLEGLINTAPYARRLNEGFSGMTDAAGRHFEAWPIAYPQGYHWAEAAVEAVQGSVEGLFSLGIEKQLEEI
jgi:hypothetical protein